MGKPYIAAPTFLFRERAPRELPEILRQYRRIGFDGVEFAGFFGWSKEDIKEMLRENGLRAAGNNLPIYDVMEHMEETLETHAKLGFPSLTVGNLKEEHLPGGERFSEMVEWLCRLGEACEKYGLLLLYHNHDFELRRLAEGRPMLEVLLSAVPERWLKLQPDLGWMQIGGGDPIVYLKTYKDRCPSIHVKDFYAEDMDRIGNPFDLEGKKGGENRGYFEFRPAGYGISGIAAQMAYIRECCPQWLVTCHDCSYERDPFLDLELGYNYINRLWDIQSS